MTPSSDSSRSRTVAASARGVHSAPPGRPRSAPAAPPTCGGAAGVDDVQLGQVDPAQAEVLGRVEDAGSATARVVCEQRGAGRSPVPGEPLGDGLHRHAGLLRWASALTPVDVPRVEGDEPAGRVEHVGGRGAGRRRRSARRW